MLRLTSILIVFTALLVCTAMSSAQDFDKGLQAAARGDHADALREWRPLAEQGHARAQFSLGTLYGQGKGVPQDYAEALRWYRLAADQGNTWAQYNLGMMNQRGEGIPRNNPEAARWFRLAAEHGLAQAQVRLGLSYFLGEGVPQDYVLAHKWLNLAAGQGHEGGVSGRYVVETEMTRDQIAEAQKLAREWLEARSK